MLRLEANDIFAGYGKIEVLHGATIRAAAGEVICIIGPNGSGKSTLLKAVFGLLKPAKGTVSFNGRDITRLDPEENVRLGIAFIPQGRNVFPSLTVRENLEMGGTVLKDEKAVRLAIEEAIEAYPLLKRKIRDRAGNLSGGEKQILSLARADMIRPDLILMDEPSIGLSPKMIDEVYSKIGEINRRGTTFAIVEQNARKALGIAHRGYVLDLGRTRLEDTGAGLLNNEEVKKLYLGG
jgi:ABC-type branched-subunit amino acid transport system ATPase component